MPYFITVLALVFIGVGFTLFHQNEATIGLTEETPILTTDTTSVTSSTTLATATSSSESIVVPTPTQEVPRTEPSAPTPQTPTPAPAPTSPSPVTAPVNTNDYTNGNYASQMSYRTPDGTYTMDVTVTVNNDKITAANVGFDSRGARDGYSKRFSSAYKSAIIGQDIGSANLSRVGGASLTTKAFNNALNSIRTQAS